MANIPISSFTAAANATGIGMSGFSLTGTNAQSMLDLAGTWNTSGTPTGIKINVTDTASNVASLLADLQVSGTSRFYVTKVGGGYFAGRVGVGTTSPETTLTVGGTAGSVTGAAFSVYETSTGNNARLRVIQSAGFVTYDATYSNGGNQQIWSNGGTERMRLTEAGNLGIGTNSPGALLDVNGTARAGNFRVNAGGSVTGAGMWGIDTILAFNTGSTERMRIDSAGNLGVGTSTPGYLVQVGSRISLGSDGVIQWGSAFTGTSRGLLSWDTNIASINAAADLVLATNGTTSRVRILSTGEVCVGRTNSLNNGTLSVLGTATQAITAQVTVNGNSLIQGYNASTGLTFQVIGTGQAYFADNVGIGTLSPAARIHTNGGSGGINAIFESNTATETRIEYRNNTTRAGYLEWGANEVRLLADTARSITSYTGGVERTRVKSTGQVRFIPLASAPAGPEAGDVYYDSTTNKLRCYNGTIWNDLF